MPKTAPSVRTQHFQKVVYEMAKQQLRCNLHDSHESEPIQKCIFEGLDSYSRDMLEELAHDLASNKDLVSLNCLQHMLFSLAIAPLKSYFEALPIERSRRIRKSLDWLFRLTTSGCIKKVPRPRDAPQPFWDQCCQSILFLGFQPQWKRLVRKFNIRYGLYPCDTKFFSWKQHAIASYALKAILKRSKTEASPLVQALASQRQSLHIHKHLCLSDHELAGFISSFKAIDSIQLEECEGAKEQTSQALAQTLSCLRSLKVRKSPHIALDLKGPYPLESLSLNAQPLQPWISKLDSFTRLKELDLSETDIEDKNVAPFVPMPSIRSLNLSRCQGVGSMGIKLMTQSLPYLRHLNLSHNEMLHSSLLLDLSPQIDSIDLSWCNNLDDLGLEYLLRSAPSLKSLKISHCSRLTAIGFENLQQAYKLSSLEVDFCLGIDPLQMDATLEKLQLRHLSLKGCEIWPHDWAHIFKPCLRSLALGKNFSATDLIKAHLPNLKLLHLQDCRHLEPADFRQLLKSPWQSQIRQLCFENASHFDTSCMASLEGCCQLQRLRLWATPRQPQLIEQGFEVLSKLPHLQRLELACNGMLDLKTLTKVLASCPSLKSVELGPIFKLEPDDIIKLRKRLPWIHITCYTYPGCKAF